MKGRLTQRRSRAAVAHALLEILGELLCMCGSHAHRAPSPPVFNFPQLSYWCAWRVLQCVWLHFYRRAHLLSACLPSGHNRVGRAPIPHQEAWVRVQLVFRACIATIQTQRAVFGSCESSGLCSTVPEVPPSSHRLHGNWEHKIQQDSHLTLPCIDYVTFGK